MWKCSKCEASVEDTEKVCPACGEPCPEDEIEEVAPVEVEETEELEETDEIVSEEIEETEEIEPTVWFCEGCGAECDGDVCEVCGQERPVEEIAPKKSSKIYGFVIAVSVVVLITIGIFTYFFFNRYVEKTGEDGLVTYQDIENSMDGITGDEIALKIDGVEVPRDIFETICAEFAIEYQSEYCGGDISKLDGFKWTDKSADGKKTHREQVIEDAVNYCNKIYSLIALGEDFNIQPSQVTVEKIDDLLYQQEDMFGKEFKSLLKMSGFDSIETYRNYRILHEHYNAVAADLEANPDRYIGDDLSVYDTDKPEYVYIRTILVYDDGDMKATKKKAKKIIKEAETEDFKALVRKYDESGDPEHTPIMLTPGMLSSSNPEMEALEKAAMSLKMGEVSKPIETPLGYFVLKRVATTTEVLDYVPRSSKIVANKSLIEDIEINVDYKKIYEKEHENDEPEVEDEAEEAEIEAE